MNITNFDNSPLFTDDLTIQVGPAAVNSHQDTDLPWLNGQRPSPLTQQSNNKKRKRGRQSTIQASSSTHTLLPNRREAWFKQKYEKEGNNFFPINNGVRTAAIPAFIQNPDNNSITLKSPKLEVKEDILQWLAESGVTEISLKGGNPLAHEELVKIATTKGIIVNGYQQMQQNYAQEAELPWPPTDPTIKRRKTTPSERSGSNVDDTPAPPSQSHYDSFHDLIAGSSDEDEGTHFESEGMSPAQITSPQSRTDLLPPPYEISHEMPISTTLPELDHDLSSVASSPSRTNSTHELSAEPFNEDEHASELFGNPLSELPVPPSELSGTPIIELPADEKTTRPLPLPPIPPLISGPIDTTIKSNANDSVSNHPLDPPPVPIARRASRRR